MNLRDTLHALGLKPNQIKVYLALTELGENTAATIAKRANLPRTTTISILDTLVQDGYITSHRYRGVTYYWIESPQVIVNLLKQKTALAIELSDSLTNLYRSAAHFPSSQTFDTKAGIRNFIERMLAAAPKKSTICTIDAPHAGNYAKIFSEGIEISLLKSKRIKNITTKSLIPYGSYKSIERKKLSAQDIEIRELPKEIQFQASVWFMNKALVLFSGNPPLALSLQHDVIVSSMRSIYDYLWSISAPV